jgi:uncharacterized protein
VADFGAAQWALFVATVMLAFCVRGGAGFGGGVVAAPLLAMLVPLQMVVPLISGMNTTSALAQGVRDWRNAAWREIARIVPFALAGVVAGIFMLANLDAQPLSRAFGAFVVLYSLYVLVFKGKTPRIPRRWLTPVAAVISLFAGVIGSLFGGGVGPVFVMYLNSLQVEKDRFRTTMNMLMLIMGTTRLIGLVIAGMITQQVLLLLAVALPLAFIAGHIGALLARRIDQQAFSRLVGCVMLASGCILMLK